MQIIYKSIQLFGERHLNLLINIIGAGTMGKAIGKLAVRFSSKNSSNKPRMLNLIDNEDMVEF